MHAVVVEVDIHDQEAAQRQLTGTLVPMISKAPGFVAGYWMAIGENQGCSVAVFDSEEHARAVAERAREATPPEVTIRSIRDGVVVAHA